MRASMQQAPKEQSLTPDEWDELSALFPEEPDCNALDHEEQISCSQPACSDPSPRAQEPETQGQTASGSRDSFLWHALQQLVFPLHDLASCGRHAFLSTDTNLTCSRAAQSKRC